MPPLLGALAAAALTSALGATAAALVGSVISAAASFVMQALLAPSSSGNRPSATSNPAPARQMIENKITIQQAASARPFVYGETRVGGVMFFAHAVENDQRLLLAIALAGHEIEAIDEVWLNDEIVTLDGVGQVTSGKYVGYVLIRKHLGAADQAADANFISAAPDVWTAEHRAGGIAYLAVELLYNAEVFPSGLPNITAKIRGKNDIYDPRDASTGYSNNSALCVANYLCDQVYGRKVDYATGIDEAALIVAANACDEQVPLSRGGAETRYTTDGALLSSIEPQEALGRLLGAMHGKLPFDGERWRIQAGVYQAPVLTFTDADLRAGPKIQTLTSRREAFNAVKGTFVGADNNWQTADFPPLVSSTFRALDGDLELYKDIELPLTSSAARAQRIAKIDLLKARQQIAATMPCKLSGWRVQAGDTIAWTSTRYGWTAKPFEVSSVRFELYTDSAGAPALGVTLELRETASSIYDWDTSEESPFDPAPNTTLPDPFTVLPPTNLSVAEEVYSTRDGAGVKARALMSWAASPDGFTELYQPRFRVSGGDWTTLPRVAGLAATLNDLAPDSYEFAVAAVNVLGVLSPYDTAYRVITGLQDPPAAPTGFTVFASGGWALLRWAQSDDLDVRIGGALEIRWSSTEAPYYIGEGTDLLGEGATLIGLVDQAASWDTASPLIDSVPGADTHASVPLRTGTYLAKFRDSTGIYSVDAALVEAVQGTGGWAALASTYQDPTFTGAKTNCSVATGELVLTAGSATGLYEFASTLNLGAVHLVRATALVVATVVNNSATVDSAELVDSAEDWDETVSGSEAASWVEYRSTSDNPSGSPVWSAWQRLEAAELDAFAFQFRYQQASYDLDYGIETSGLAVIVEERV